MENLNDINEEVFYELAEVFKVFGDTTRIGMLSFLLKGERSVQEISEKIGISQSAISHQLRILRHAKLVKFRKDGKEAYYSLDDKHIEDILNIALEHIKER